MCSSVFTSGCCLCVQAAWEEEEQSLVELAQTRSRVQQLRSQLQARRKEADEEVSGLTDELQTDAMALYVQSGHRT